MRGLDQLPRTEIAQKRIALGKLSKDFDRGVYDKSEYKAEKEKILKRYDKVVELEYERQTEKE